MNKGNTNMYKNLISFRALEKGTLRNHCFKRDKNKEKNFKQLVPWRTSMMYKNNVWLGRTLCKIIRNLS